EILTGELPFEGPRRGLPVILKIQEAFGDGVEIGKIIGCQDLALDNREVDFNLVEPTRMNWGMDEPQAGVEIPETLHGSGATRRSKGAMPFFVSQRPKTLARWTSKAAI